MKKCLFIISVSLLLLTSCNTQRPTIIPKTVNTVSTATFKDLNLNRADYEVLNTITAEATVVYNISRNKQHVVIKGVDDDFELDYKFQIKKQKWDCFYTGILKLGYLSNDYTSEDTWLYSPEVVARRMAIYRAINESRFQGADGLIEPTISTNVEQMGRDIVYKSTVTAKAIKIKVKK